MITETKKNPKLRFPEFSGEWQMKKLSYLAKIGTGKKDTQDKINNGRYPFFVRSDTVERINTVGYEGEAILTSGDGVGVGKNYHYIVGKFDFHQRVYAIRDFSDDVIGKFVYYYFSDSFFNRVMKMNAKNSVDSVRMNMIADMPIPNPEIDEQQEIAGFLTKVDERVEAMAKKLELLQKYKKGVMQKVFPPTGGQVPEIRFKDENGNDFPDWHETTLSSVMTESRTKGSKGDMAQKLTVKLWGKGVLKKEGKTKGSINTQYYIRHKGQFIYSKLDFLNCAFGIVPDELVGWESTVDLPCFDIHIGYSPHLILEMAKSKSFYKKLGERADGSRKAKRIHADTFLGFTMQLPVAEEQQKIADFLTSIDDKIKSQERKLEQAKQFKKALLQQMFV